jgi:hypothetical protein
MPKLIEKSTAKFKFVNIFIFQQTLVKAIQGLCKKIPRSPIPSPTNAFQLFFNNLKM